MSVNRDEFRQSLAQFEACLETPRVPGELPGWIRSLEHSFVEVVNKIERQIDGDHRDQLVAIGEQAPGLLSRVEQLRGEDVGIANELAQLACGMQRLAAAASSVEPDETRFEQEVTDLVDQSLLFVLRVRKQETALTTWLIEAFGRDRGTVD